MPPKKKQKADSEECSKICIIHFSSSNEQNFVNLFQAADKDKKFEKIKQIAFKRLNQPDRSSYKLSEQCANIPTTLMNHHGCHRDCYQRFTKNVDRLEDVEQISSSGMNRRSLTLANKWNDGVVFKCFSREHKLFVYDFVLYIFFTWKLFCNLEFSSYCFGL